MIRAVRPAACAGVTLVELLVAMVIASIVGSMIRGGDTRSRFHDIQIARCELGTKLVFALELMIVSDLLQTIISRSIDDLIFLGGLVVHKAVRRVVKLYNPHRAFIFDDETCHCVSTYIKLERWNGAGADCDLAYVAHKC